MLSRQSERLESMWRSGDTTSTSREVIREDDEDFDSVNQSPISNFELSPSGELSPSETSIFEDGSLAGQPASAEPDPSMAQIAFVNGTISEGFSLEDHETDNIVLNLLTDAEIFGWNRPAPRRFNRKLSLIHI